MPCASSQCDHGGRALGLCKGIGKRTAPFDVLPTFTIAPGLCKGIGKRTAPFDVLPTFTIAPFSTIFTAAALCSGCGCGSGKFSLPLALGSG